MSRVRFTSHDGCTRMGVWTDQGIRFGGRVFDPQIVDIHAPTLPSKIIGFGGNHESQVANREIFDEPATPGDLWSYIKTPDSVIGHRDTIELPPGEETVYELELGVVIGEQCRNVSADDAAAVIDGYTIYNDVTRRRPENLMWKKAFDGSAPLGPVIVTPEALPGDATFTATRDGEEEQTGSRAGYIFSEHELIEYVTRHLTLEPGDLLSLGATYGYGPLADGDRIELSVEGIGTLTNDVSIVEKPGGR